MKTKLFSLFLMLIISVGNLFASVLIGDLYYNLDALNLTAEVAGWNHSSSGSVAIPPSVTYNSVSYSVTNIGSSAFYGCSGLTSVTIPNSVTSIGKGAFRGCSGLPIHNHCRYADTYLVEAVDKTLSTYTIKEGTRFIGDAAFWDCSGMNSMTIPNSVTSIGDYAFYHCSSLPVIDNCRYADTYLVEAVDKTLSTYTIKDGTIFIGSEAFAGCTGLTSVTIPNSVKSIGKGAFYNCSGLTSVTIGNSVKSIGDGAFGNCSGLTSVTIPNSVTSIEDNAFSYCRGLTSVTIGNGVKSIGDHAFDNCSGLTSVTIPNSVTSIGDFAFEYCSGLTSVTIGNSVKSIGWNAFSNCSGLSSVSIPNSVKSIGKGAFASCSSLTSINVTNNHPTYSSFDGVLFNKDKTVLVQCPGAKNGIYTIPHSVTSIEGGAFDGCRSLTSVMIPNGVTSIGSEAFCGCSGLTSVTIPNSVTSIGMNAFAHCSSLSSVTIPNSVTSIGNYAFSYCSGLTSVTIPNSVTSIGDCVFQGCSSLTSVTIPNSVTSIGKEAFRECIGLTSVTIGNSVTSIGKRAFYNCKVLISITCFTTTPPQLGENVFANVDESIPLYVQAESISAYQSADGWKDFTNIFPIGAQPVDVATTTVTPSETTVDIAWPQVNGAASYELVIKDKNGNVVCTLVFDAEGHLTSLTFNAPARNNAPQQTQAAGFSFTITGLESGTTYNYTITAKGNSGNVLKTESGTFTTNGEPQGIEDVQSDQVQGSKILRNGQIFILRGEKEYTLTGQEVK